MMQRRMMFALLGAVLASPATSEPQPAPVPISPGRPYTLSLATPVVLAQKTVSQAKIVKIGRIAKTTFDPATPVLLSTGVVQMVIARTGKPDEVHTLRCRAEAFGGLRFEHRRGSDVDSPAISVPLTTPVANKVVQDADDGAKDNVYNYNFTFGSEPRDLIIVHAAVEKGLPWRFASCMLKGSSVVIAGNTPPAVAPLVAKTDQPYRISAATPRWRTFIGGTDLDAGIFDLENVDYVNESSDLRLETESSVAYPARIRLLVTRIGKPGAKHRLYCSTGFSRFTLDHYRPKTGVKAIKSLDDVEYFTSNVQTTKADQFPYVYVYDFYFGLTEQDLFVLRPSAGSSRFNYCYVSLAPT